VAITPAGTREIPLAGLARFPGNARRGNVTEIRASVRRLGQYRAIVVRDTGDGMVILAGNHTADALAAEGYETARCEVITCTDTEARKINVADNRLGELPGPDGARYDDAALAGLLTSLDGDFEATGWEPEDVQALLATSDPDSSPGNGAHVGNNSGDNEWYTPPEYIKAAAAVMGGIDLDPASSEAANETVGAATYFTADDDGLTQPWAGRVWMNPPYAQPLCDRFCARLAREFASRSVTEACVLVNNGTETAWFQEMATQASAICFPRGRVKFRHGSGKDSASPLQGQAVLYLGPNADGFRSEFLRFGFAVIRGDLPTAQPEPGWLNP
jgi:phage N-6-adenine-methyltransferase